MSRLFQSRICKLNPTTNRRCRLWILVVLAALFAAWPMAAQKGKPLAVKDVVDLLNGGVASSEIAGVVTENGISFQMSDELESQFRAAGATDELIIALEKASKSGETKAATGTLRIQSQPGGVQVYINDEPKGTTGQGGELRLPGMAPGPYRLRLELTGYKTWANPITITAGETFAAFVIMEKQDLTPAVTLDADRSSIERGQSVYLRWTSTNASDVDIEPGVGKVAMSGATSVSPRESTTFSLTAIGPGGIKTATTYVAVTAPPPPPPTQRVVGNLPGFPIPGASFKEIKFFESGSTEPPLGSRGYQASFNHHNTRFVNWELHITCPAVVSRIDFTVYATWYYPNGRLFGNQSVNVHSDIGSSELVYSSGRGWQRTGMWLKGTYRVDLFVNGNRIGSGSFTVF